MKVFRRRGAATVERGAEARWKRVVRRVFYVKLALVGIGLVAVGALYLRLVSGPLSLQGYSANLADSLASRIGPGWRVALGGTAVQMLDGRPSVRVTGLEIRNPAGVLLVRSPEATVTLDPAGLFTGTLSPRDIDLRQLQLAVLVGPDGTLSFVTAADDRPVPAESLPAPPVAPSPGDQPPSSAVAKAVASLLDPVLRPTGIVGALDRASVTDARLTLIGSDGRERLAFRDVDALFVRQEGGARHFELGFEGRRGAWRIDGEVAETEGGRRATVRAHDVPLEDAMLLGGLSAVPGSSDLKLSGDVQAIQSGGRLVTLAGNFESPGGSITLPGQDSVRIDRLAGSAAWNEAEGRLELSGVDLRSGAAAIRVDGTLAAAGEGAWTLAVSGRDGVLPGATASDPPLKLAEIGAQFGLVPDAIVVERVSLKGEGVDVGISGASVPSPDGMGLRATIEARQTGVRQLLALWPATVNPELRNYLARNFRSGTLESMRLGTNLDANDLRHAFSGKPISDGALSLAFTVTDGRLTIIDGLPPLRRLGIVGSATGTTTTLAAKQGRVDMPDGRRLSFADGSYHQMDEDKPGSVARIAFRLEGGADAVASFLRSPVFGDLGPVDIDPAAVKGKAEFQVSLPLAVHNIPKVADLPISVTGKLTDLSVDKVFGREKLEGATLAVTYESGALGIKGEGRLGGSPATLDLRQPRGGAGEVLVAMTLDEAARARRSLPVGPQVTGPVALKLVAPFGHKGATRMEADLSRAAIDGLLPGWTKPAGRPGRLSFTIPEADGGATELRDVVLESGPVQLRGSAAFAADGSLDKADLATLKLSPGDDLSARVDRSAGTYRVNLKGNVGDARPVLKWLTGSPAGSSPAGGSGGQKGKEPADLDVEAAINIVTGHNDEALTGVTAKFGTKGRDLKALQLRGQFRAAPFEAQLVRRESGPPQVVVRTGDAGASLRFLDIYKRMIGGEMNVQTTVGDTQAGTISIGSFGLRDEPALRSIATTVSQAGSAESGAVPVPFDSNQVDFTKLTAEFKRTANRIDYKDVVIWGAQVGFNLTGYVDYGRDRTDILGTFVPAYGLNNAFSQVPIVGMILGGGRNEGLFAIDFRISGQASAPTMTVNPLTVVAPGILRKLFGWMMEEDATGATAPPPAERPKAPAVKPKPR